MPLHSLRIDFVSDIVCPWCAIGLASLEIAMRKVSGEIDVELHVQPFELNPHLGRDGEDAVVHLRAKYGLDEAQVAANQERIRARGAELGFVFDMARRRHVYNTFDAHRLLHWAGLEGRQLPLKLALLEAYHGQGRDPGNHEVLVEIAESVGLDATRARQVLQGGDYADDVREAERENQSMGLTSVPAIIFNRRYLVSGGQPVEAFEQAIRDILAEASTA